MPNITFIPASDRFLSLAEREEIALLRAQQYGVVRSQDALTGTHRRFRGN
jgi:hypothetical protein